MQDDGKSAVSQAPSGASGEGGIRGFFFKKNSGKVDSEGVPYQQLGHKRSLDEANSGARSDAGSATEGPQGVEDYAFTKTANWKGVTAAVIQEK